MEAEMETVASVELEAGDVFALVGQPEDVVGEVFWKHPRLRRIKRAMDCGDGNVAFADIRDLSTQVYLQGPFKRAKVIRITNFKPTSSKDRLELPW